ncbi:MAG: Nif3-like dinuclear metal center hexameric protein [Candidatus Kryptoniota bacterium]
MKLQEIVKKIYDNLPIKLVSDGDNVGLIAGNYDDECEKMTVAYELNNGVLDEVLQNHSNLLVTYHTPLFRPTKSFTSSNSKPNSLFEAARAGVNVLAVHTALDVVRDGLNFDLAARLGLKNIRFLSPLKDTLYKIVVFVPQSHLDQVRRAMSEAGAGRIGNYFECSFALDGKGSFVPNEEASPYIGQPGKFESVDEARLEMVVERSLIGAVVSEMLKTHPYEEAAYDVYPLSNDSANFGFGAIGELDEPVQLKVFIGRVKEIVGLDSVKASHLPEVEIKKVALCAGSGVPFYSDAVKNGADVFVTGDVKHHDFREAQPCPAVLVDATHHGTEKYVPEVMLKIMNEIFRNEISVRMSKYWRENFIAV